MKTIERKNSPLTKSRADLLKFLPVLISAHIAFSASANAQDASQTPKQSDASAGETQEDKAEEEKTENSKPENKIDPVIPLEGQLNDKQPNNGGVKPMITPLAPTAVPPVDGAPQVIEGDAPATINGELPDPANPDTLEEEPTEGEAEEELLPDSEQEQIVSSLSDELFFSLSSNSLSSTLTPTPTLGGSDGSISEMAALLAPGLPVAYSNKGISFTAGVTEIYDSNPARLAETSNPEGDWITSGSLSVAYRPINPSLWSINGSYRGGYNWYLNNKEFNAVFHNGAASLSYNGVRLSSIFRGNFTMSTGASRDIGLVVDQFNYGISNNTRYSLSGKTSLDAELSYRRNEFSGNFSDVLEDQLARVSGVWHYSPLTDFGLGLRSTYQSISSRSERTSIGPSFLANYRYSQRLSFRSQASMEFATINQNISKIGVDTNIGILYLPSPQWSMSLDLRRSNQPLPGAVSTFQSLTGVRLGCSRQMTRSTLSASIGYEFADMENFGKSGVTSKAERKFVSFDTSITRAVYLDRLYGSLFARYSDQGGNFGQTFESMQFGLGFTHVF